MTRVTAYGERSVLVEDIEPIGFLEPLRLALPQAEIRTGLESLLITFGEVGNHALVVEELLKQIKPEPISVTGNLLNVTVKYNGDDLEIAAQLASITTEKLIQAHTSITWQVKLIGFAPGFPYLVPTEESEDADLLSKIGRLSVPRRQVPAGSVGLAAGMSCIYPAVMPGGWHLIGITEVSLFDANNQEQPNLLAIGDQVKFEVAN